MCHVLDRRRRADGKRRRPYMWLVLELLAADLVHRALRVGHDVEVPSGLSLISGVTPKFSPKSSDSLSVISYLPRLSATRSLSRRS